ncbi:MAG: potassium channel family protein [Lachnospiraceae bacterium]
MRVIVIGCGRLGRGIARKMDRQGDEVIAIDKNDESLKKLGDGFEGTTICGLGFDKDVLESAGIQRADALIATTNKDEVNALTARMARVFYKVPRVIARLYDGQRADIYNAMGIQVLSTTMWGIRKAAELLSYSHVDSVWEIGGGAVEMLRIEVNSLLAGRTVHSLNKMGEIQVVAMWRKNKVHMPTDGMVFEKNDVVYVSVANTALATFKEMLGLD